MKQQLNRMVYSVWMYLKKVTGHREHQFLHWVLNTSRWVFHKWMIKSFQITDEYCSINYYIVGSKFSNGTNNNILHTVVPNLLTFIMLGISNFKLFIIWYCLRTQEVFSFSPVKRIYWVNLPILLDPSPLFKERHCHSSIIIKCWNKEMCKRVSVWSDLSSLAKICTIPRVDWPRC